MLSRGVKHAEQVLYNSVDAEQEHRAENGICTKTGEETCALSLVSRGPPEEEINEQKQKF